VTANAENARPAKRNRFFVIAAAALLFIGVTAMIFGGSKLIDGMATAGWVRADATVTGTEVLRTSIDPPKAPRHVYRVTTEYEVDGEFHELTYQTSLKRTEPRIGSTVPIRYDPESPDDARRGVGGTDVIAGPVVAGLGLIAAVGAILLFRRTGKGPITVPGYRMTRSVRFGKDRADGDPTP
jgi:hypothetical protein